MHIKGCLIKYIMQSCMQGNDFGTWIRYSVLNLNDMAEVTLV